MIINTDIIISVLCACYFYLVCLPLYTMYFNGHRKYLVFQVQQSGC